MPDNAENKPEDSTVISTSAADNEASALDDILHVLGITKFKKIDKKERPLKDKKISGRKPLFSKKICQAIAILCASVGIILLLPQIFKPKPLLLNDIVFSFSERSVTVAEFEAFIKAQNRNLSNMDDYRQMAELYASHQLVFDWANKKGVTQREEVQKAFSDYQNGALVVRYIQQLYDESNTVNNINRWEIQQYYDANSGSYQNNTFAEAEAEIRRILMTEQKRMFLAGYTDELKKSAGVNINVDLLSIDDPQEINLRKNETLFTIRSRRITLGDFYFEFNKYPVNTRLGSKLSRFEAKKGFAELMIDQELLLEESMNRNIDKDEEYKRQVWQFQFYHLLRIYQDEEFTGQKSYPTSNEAMERLLKEAKFSARDAILKRIVNAAQFG